MTYICLLGPSALGKPRWLTSPAQGCPSQSSVTLEDSALDNFNFQEVLFRGFPSAGDVFWGLDFTV